MPHPIEWNIITAESSSSRIIPEVDPGTMGLYQSSTQRQRNIFIHLDPALIDSQEASIYLS
eukprot:8589485-Pyramimonas_sp.AAC.1